MLERLLGIGRDVESVRIEGLAFAGAAMRVSRSQDAASPIALAPDI
jgi:hypothetical protein